MIIDHNNIEAGHSVLFDRQPTGLTLDDVHRFNELAHYYFEYCEANGLTVMWFGDTRNGAHKVTLEALLAGPWRTNKLHYAIRAYWRGDTFGLDLTNGETLEIVALSEDDAANIEWPCLYTRGVEECMHAGCRDEHIEALTSIDYAEWVAINGEACTHCGHPSFMRCARMECDAITCEECDAEDLTFCAFHTEESFSSCQEESELGAERAAVIDKLTEFYQRASDDAECVESFGAWQFERGHHAAIKSLCEWIAGPDPEGRGIGLDRIDREIGAYLLEAGDMIKDYEDN